MRKGHNRLIDSLIIVKTIVRLITHMGRREEVATGDSEETQRLTLKLIQLTIKLT